MPKSSVFEHIIGILLLPIVSKTRMMMADVMGIRQQTYTTKFAIIVRMDTIVVAAG